MYQAIGLHAKCQCTLYSVKANNQYRIDLNLFCLMSINRSKLVFEECDRNNKSAKLEPQSHKEKEPIFSPVPTKYKLRTVSIRIERDEALEQKLLDAMRQDQVDTMEDDTKEPEFIEPERRYPKRNRTKRFNISPANSASQSNKENDAAEKDEEKMDFLYSWYKVSFFDICLDSKNV